MTRSNTDQDPDKCVITRRQLVRYAGNVLGEVREEKDGIIVWRKRERGGKFDRHFVEWARVAAYTPGAGGRRGPGFALVMEMQQFTFTGKLTRDADGYVIDVGGVDRIVQRPEPGSDVFVMASYAAEKPRRRGDAQDTAEDDEDAVDQGASDDEDAGGDAEPDESLPEFRDDFDNEGGGDDAVRGTFHEDDDGGEGSDEGYEGEADSYDIDPDDPNDDGFDEIGTRPRKSDKRQSAARSEVVTTRRRKAEAPPKRAAREAREPSRREQERPRRGRAAEPEQTRGRRTAPAKQQTTRRTAAKSGGKSTTKPKTQTRAAKSGKTAGGKSAGARERSWHRS